MYIRKEGRLHQTHPLARANYLGRISYIRKALLIKCWNREMPLYPNPTHLRPLPRLDLPTTSCSWDPPTRSMSLLYPLLAPFMAVNMKWRKGGAEKGNARQDYLAKLFRDPTCCSGEVAKGRLECTHAPKAGPVTPRPPPARKSHIAQSLDERHRKEARENQPTKTKPNPKLAATRPRKETFVPPSGTSGTATVACRSPTDLYCRRKTRWLLPSFLPSLFPKRAIVQTQKFSTQVFV